MSTGQKVLLIGAAAVVLLVPKNRAIVTSVINTFATGIGDVFAAIGVAGVSASSTAVGESMASTPLEQGEGS